MYYILKINIKCVLYYLFKETFYSPLFGLLQRIKDFGNHTKTMENLVDTTVKSFIYI